MAHIHKELLCVRPIYSPQICSGDSYHESVVSFSPIHMLPMLSSQTLYRVCKYDTHVCVYCRVWMCAKVIFGGLRSLK